MSKQMLNYAELRSLMNISVTPYKTSLTEDLTRLGISMKNFLQDSRQQQRA